MARRRRRKRKNGNTTPLSVLIVAIIIVWGFYTKAGSKPNGSNIANQDSSKPTSTMNNNSTLKSAKPAQKIYGGLSKSDYDKLAKLNFKSGDGAYVAVNQDKSTLIKHAWKVNRVIYSNLDNLNRTSHSNTAFLEKRNVANDSLRVRQVVEPTAWHYNRRNGQQIYNRGHLIAYSVSAGIDQDGDYEPNNLSGDQNNPKNLFTQSAFSNQKIQTIFESQVRDALRDNEKIIYQATPIFRGNELMARGINLQAVSSDGSLDFNVYLFNVQPGYVFNYHNGRAKVDHQMRVNSKMGI